MLMIDKYICHLFSTVNKSNFIMLKALLPAVKINLPAIEFIQDWADGYQTNKSESSVWSTFSALRWFFDRTLLFDLHIKELTSSLLYLRPVFSIYCVFNVLLWFCMFYFVICKFNDHAQGEKFKIVKLIISMYWVLKLSNLKRCHYRFVLPMCSINHVIQSFVYLKISLTK